ncbi:hypothetical protein ABW21_db0204098 [Orbilia brochopaga]|nr:hypothetical protein ABW21_db0204098 [Drechslerella brochopaga]
MPMAPKEIDLEAQWLPVRTTMADPYDQQWDIRSKSAWIDLEANDDIDVGLEANLGAQKAPSWGRKVMKAMLGLWFLFIKSTVF